MKKSVLLVFSMFLTMGLHVNASAGNANSAMPAIISYLLSDSSPTPTVSKLLKTGQTKCYGENANEKWVVIPCSDPRAKGQDGYYQKGVERSYSAYPESPTSHIIHSTIKDNVTGFTWYDNNQALASIIAKNWQDAKQYCEDLTFGGLSDWRLPNVYELQSLVDYGRCRNYIQNSLGSINPIFKYGLSEAGSEYHYKFWSSTLISVNNSLAWLVDFDQGWDNSLSKKDLYIVRCVKGEPFAPFAKNPVSSSNGIAIDSDTGLMWQDNDDVGVETSWKEAIEYCEDLTLGGYTDWRLPNITELFSIVDKEKDNEPYLKDGFIQKESWYFWSSTTDTKYTSMAWCANFYGGSHFFNHKSNSTKVRCVR